MILINLFKNTRQNKDRRRQLARRNWLRINDPEKFKHEERCRVEWGRKNRDRKRASQLRWNAANPDRIKSAGLKYMYGITIEIYDNMVAQQKGLCAICLKPPTTGRRKVLYVDHCHTTKKVRELLCHTCNMGIGQFGDDIGRLEAAIAYLKKHSS